MMNVLLRRGWVLLPLLVLAAVSYWLTLPTGSLPMLASDHKANDDPDAVMYQFAAMGYDMNGQPAFVLNADKMEYVFAQKDARLTMPRMSFLTRDEKQGTIHIVARRGEMKQDGADVYLYDDIEVLREGTPSSQELRVQTSYLHIQPEAERVMTDQPVKVFGRNHTIEAVGLFSLATAIDINFNIKFLSHFCQL